MKQYDWILFDADETLFQFDDFTGLQRMFSAYAIKFTQEDYQEYKAISKLLWESYQNGIIASLQLQHQRFDVWAERLQVSSRALNDAFLAEMTQISAPSEGALQLVTALQGKAKLGIITNGTTEFQKARLERTGFKNYIDILVISEEIGIAKPHHGIFDHAFSMMGNPARDKVLMVGDSLDTDILGGVSVGIDTCWLNVKQKPLCHIIPNYHISSLTELEKLLLRNAFLASMR